MKESTGELSMVVITIIAVLAVLAIWNAVKDPISTWVKGKFGDMGVEMNNCPAGKTYDAKTGKCK